MKINKLLMLSAFGTAMALPSFAQADSLEMPDEYIYVGGHISQFYYHMNRHPQSLLDQATLPGAQIGWKYDKNWSIQASWERNGVYNKDRSARGSLSNTTASIRYHFDSSLLGFQPYVGGNGGNLRFAKHNNAQYVGLETGVQKMLAPFIALDLGARPTWNLDESQWDAAVYAGLNIVFGKKSSTQQKSEPKSEPAQEPEVFVDTDGDGIPDHLDKCADTPQGAKVDADGCAVVLTEDVREQAYVQFALGKADVQEGSLAEIEKIAALVKQYPDAQVQLVGHSDNTGNANLNLRLSKERAASVRQILVDDFGIAANRITSDGVGSNQPIADNSTAEGRAQNRRVEVVMKAQVESIKFED